MTSRCCYLDSGYCYAPKNVPNNSCNGQCLFPTSCPFLMRYSSEEKEESQIEQPSYEEVMLFSSDQKAKEVDHGEITFFYRPGDGVAEANHPTVTMKIDGQATTNDLFQMFKQFLWACGYVLYENSFS